ncbi:glycosyltransferase family 9 protein [Chlamydiota bacterium]
MKYPIHNRLAYCAIFCIDWLLKIGVRPFLKINSFPTSPKSILLCNIAHLGDVILSTSLLPVLWEAFPHARIGMLVGSWSRPLVEGHPLIDRYHLIDHWKISRAKESLIRKVLRYYRMRKAIRKEIAHYDLAIDCGLHFPNMSPLLWHAGIPHRIGFATAGFGPLLTHAHSWNPLENRSAAEAYCALLDPLPLNRSLLRPTLATSTPHPKPHMVIHMGSGNPQKNWPEAKWRSLVERLISDGERLLFTGLGPEEHATIERVRAHLPHTQNLCDKLSWEAFMATIQNAALLIATDTSAGHIAATTNTPAVLLYTGVHPGNLWKPYGTKQVTLTHPMPCSPCLKGCREMTCIQSLSVDTVYTTIRSLNLKK